MLKKRAEENRTDRRNLPSGVDGHARRARRALRHSKPAQHRARGQRQPDLPAFFKNRRLETVFMGRTSFLSSNRAEKP